jgi:hypothetical protein
VHHERPIYPASAGLIPDRVVVRPVAKKGIAIQCEPLTGVLAFVCGEPGHLRIAMVYAVRGRGVCLGDGHSDVLLFGERQRLKRTQHPILEYGFHLTHHSLIVPLREDAVVDVAGGVRESEIAA